MPYYDYQRQAWIQKGVVVPCGHPPTMKPGCCYAGDHAGEMVAPPLTCWTCCTHEPGCPVRDAGTPCCVKRPLAVAERDRGKHRGHDTEGGALVLGAEGTVYLCDCGRVALSFEDATAHAESPLFDGEGGHRLRHDHTKVMARTERQAGEVVAVQVCCGRVLREGHRDDCAVVVNAP